MFTRVSVAGLDVSATGAVASGGLTGSISTLFAAELSMFV
jgi:hypothetical protein